MNKKIFISMIALLILANIAMISALGLTPGRTTLDFQPNSEQNIGFSIINSEHKDMNLVIYVQGDLNQSISLKENNIAMKSSEESRQMSFDVKMPETLSPGLHVAEIVVLQLPEKSSTSEAYVGAAMAVVTQVYVYVPYPGKYAEADLNIINAAKDAEAMFIIPIYSRGELDLGNVRANIDIYNKLNEKIATINTDSISLASGERKEIVGKWKANVSVGNYRAVATVIYDENTIKLEKNFNIGEEELDLQEITVNDFNLGDIAKFEMLVENKWSEPITGVYAQTNIYNNNGEVMADFKSATYEISSLSKILMISYWDTMGVKEGTYDTKVYLRYGDKSSEKDFKLEVKKNSIKAVGLGYVITTETPKDNSLIITLSIGIAVLIIINLLWFFFLRKRLKK